MLICRETSPYEAARTRSSAHVPRLKIVVSPDHGLGHVVQCVLVRLANADVHWPFERSSTEAHDGVMRWLASSVSLTDADRAAFTELIRRACDIACELAAHTHGVCAVRPCERDQIEQELSGY